MGQITIEIPEKINRKYRFISKDSVKRLLANLDKIAKQENAVEDADILGLWADRKESVDEIARDLRKKSNSRTAEND